MTVEDKVLTVLVDILTRNTDLPDTAIATAARSFVPDILACMSETRATQGHGGVGGGGNASAATDRLTAHLSRIGRDAVSPEDWMMRVLAVTGHWLEPRERDVLIKLRMMTPSGGLNNDETAVLDRLLMSPVIGADVEPSIYHAVRRIAGEVLAATFPNAPDHCARAAHTIATLVSLDTTPATRVVPSPPGQDG